ncbi:hypothetical protein DFJ74DRAFT_703690 [Hyaloraphidium curvatum]|nr:hypothetical protein DFJ74DRAFT_703690 [Hyaloraphidium curvatum]
MPPAPPSEAAGLSSLPPELLRDILRRTARRDLAACALVPELHAVATELLWDAAELDGTRIAGRLPAGEAHALLARCLAGRGGLHDYGRLVRGLAVSAPAGVGEALLADVFRRATGGRLRALRIGAGFDDGARVAARALGAAKGLHAQIADLELLGAWSCQADRILDLVAPFRGLRRFSLGFGDSFRDSGAPLVVERVIANNPHLASLGLADFPGRLRPPLLSLFSSLRTLHLARAYLLIAPRDLARCLPSLLHLSLDRVDIEHPSPSAADPPYLSGLTDHLPSSLASFSVGAGCHHCAGGQFAPYKGDVGVLRGQEGVREVRLASASPGFLERGFKALEVLEIGAWEDCEGQEGGEGEGGCSLPALHMLAIPASPSPLLAMLSQPNAFPALRSLRLTGAGRGPEAVKLVASTAESHPGLREVEVGVRGRPGTELEEGLRELGQRFPRATFSVATKG